ncbi:MAG: hypothetical protein KA408_03325 [Flavobacteriales bacterium]|nr:hypothetical protein [Flavobacteriales bacterium]
MVEHYREEHGISRACRVVVFSHSTMYRSLQQKDDTQMEEALLKKAQQYPHQSGPGIEPLDGSTG